MGQPVQQRAWVKSWFKFVTFSCELFLSVSGLRETSYWPTPSGGEQCPFGSTTALALRAKASVPPKGHCGANSPLSARYGFLVILDGSLDVNGLGHLVV